MTTYTSAGTMLGPSEPAQTLQSGQKILGRYRLNRILGQGGMGVVWLARDEELEREVALKFLPNVVVNDGASLAELKRETKRSLELTHPHIVRTYDFVQDTSIAGISMEFVDADTLRNRRVNQPHGCFEPGEIGDWTRQLCEALDYAHRQAHIVHRDLKPANLMVNGRGQLKVADFGIARSLVETVTQVTGLRGISGTLVYMSPQQLSGESAAPTDDIYAVGATLYELCTTKPPFYSGDVAGQIYGKTAPSIAERRRGLGLPAGEIPLNWEETIASCLAKEASERPQSAGEIAVRLGLATAVSIAPTNPVAMPPIARVTPPSLPGTRPFAAPPPAPATTSSPLVAPTAFPALPARTIHLPAVSKNVMKAVGLGVAAAAVGAFLLLAAAAWYFWPRHQNASGRPGKVELVPVASARGSVVIKTEPPNASVSIDGGPAQTTPAVVSDLPAGTHKVEVTRDGYNPVEMNVEVKGNQPADLGMVTLVRSVGGLKIDTEPPGLKFTLKSETDQADNRAGDTPLASANIPTGSYQAIVEREGWKPQSKPVTIVRGQEQRLSFEFPAGSLTITSIPSGAKVSVDGKVIGATPLTLPEQPPGEVRYRLSADGYESFDGVATVEQGEESAVPAARLKKLATITAKNPPSTVKKTAPTPTSTTKRSTATRSTGSSNSSSSDSGSGRRSGDTRSGAEKAADIMRFIPGGIPFR